jgi:inner membrane protein
MSWQNGPMSTILTHPVVPLALGVGLGARTLPPRLIVLGCLLCILPDIDVLAFRLGIPYASPWGHRGFTHSLFFAAVVALLFTPLVLRYAAGPMRSFLFLFLVIASHPLLDMATNGGLGCALFWPLDDSRYFLPWRPLMVSPIGGGFLSEWGLRVLRNELIWVWSPAMTAAALLWLVRWWKRLGCHKRPAASESTIDPD